MLKSPQGNTPGLSAALSTAIPDHMSGPPDRFFLDLYVYFLCISFIS